MKNTLNTLKNALKVSAKFILKICKIVQLSICDFFSLKNGSVILPSNIL